MVDIVELRKSEFWRKKIRKAVVARDANNSGTISRKDFEIIVADYKKIATNEEKFELVKKSFLSFCDKVGLVNDSVELSYEEFEGYLHTLFAEDKMAHQQKFYDMFVCLDANGDGYISLEEWKVHSGAIGGVPPEHAEESFSAMDKNKNRKVTLDEFVAYHSEFFYSTENKLNSAILFGPL